MSDLPGEGTEPEAIPEAADDGDGGSPVDSPSESSYALRTVRSKPGSMSPGRGGGLIVLGRIGPLAHCSTALSQADSTIASYIVMLADSSQS